jgi:hypothetical protein
MPQTVPKNGGHTAMIEKNDKETLVTQPPNRAENLTTWADHLRENPSDDFESILELRLPMSVQVEIMRKANEMDVTNLDVVLMALSTYGLPVDNHL